MENNIKAGVVVINRFCKSGTKTFSSYINYIDRSESKRSEMLSEYNLYNDYMENPEKTTGLFTSEKMKLTQEEKRNLKNIFSTAQKNESIMWQSIISFDNRWLEKYGLYDSKNKIFDENKIKEMATGAINKMIENENLNSAIWSAAIHYNTDNLHVHVAIVEPVPQRQKKMYKQYSYIEDKNGKYIKDAYGCYVRSNKKFIEELEIDGLPVTKYSKQPILDENGEIVQHEEFVGRFKTKSIEICKKHIVDNIILDREQNIKINNIIREKIIKQKKKYFIVKDDELVSKFMEIYNQLPRTGNRGLWNYDNNVMENLRPVIDELSEMYFEKYNKKEYEELKSILHLQEIKYKEAYGKSERSFEKNKKEELLYRMGNAILKEMREYDKNIKTTTKTDIIQQMEKNKEQGEQNINDFEVNNNLEKKELDIIDEEEMNIDYFFPEIEIGEYDLHWSKELKKAKAEINKKNGNIKYAIDLLGKESINGNALATYELGEIYANGIGVKRNKKVAYNYYNKTLEMLHAMEKLNLKVGSNGYLEYKIGKQYTYGLGTEIDEKKAFKYFKLSAEKGCKFANCSLGIMYYYGKGTEVNMSKAFKNFEIATETKKPNGYALYQLGNMYENGLGTEKDLELAYSTYEKALKALSKLDKNSNLEYRIGMMYLKGKGTKINVESAKKCLQWSSEKDNVRAKYELIMIEIEENGEKNIEKNIKELEEISQESVNGLAELALGRIYSIKDGKYYNIKDAEKWLKKASDKKNSYAQVRLGRLYANKELEIYDVKKAEEYFKMSINENNNTAKSDLAKLYLTKELYNIDEAVKLLKEISEKNSIVQYRLGNIYMDKKTKYYNLDEALHYFEKAASDNNEYAEWKAGLIYLNDEYEMKDEKKGVEYLEKSVEHGCKYPMFRLAQKLLDKKSSVYDWKKGMNYLKEMEKENPDDVNVNYILGKIYMDSEFEIYNSKKGLEYLKKAGDLGSEFAYLKLGFVYFQGEKKYPEVEKNIENARYFFGKAAEMGNEFAEKMLNGMDNFKIQRQSYKKSHNRRGRKVYFMERALIALKKSSRDEIQKQLNMYEYEKLKRKEHELERDNSEMEI